MAERAEERSLMKKVTASDLDAPYQVVFGDVSKIVDAARDSATRSVNAAMTAAYWLIGHRIIEFEQSGEERARYGTALMERLAADLTQRFGRGFSRQNIQYMRLFYVSYPSDQIRQALSGKLARPPLGVGISIPTPEDSPIGGADFAEVALNGGVRSSVRHGGPDLTKSRTEPDSLVTPSFGMGTVYVRVASSPTTSMPSTKLRMRALHSGIVPSCKKSRKSATYRAISSVLGSSTLRCSSWVSASSRAASSCSSRCLRDMMRGGQYLQGQFAGLNGLVEPLKPLPRIG